jgi:hypothetical protein
MRVLAFVCTVFFASSAYAEIDVGKIATYQRDAYNRVETQCDRLAAHPDDPEKVSPGVSQQAMDKDAAIAACKAAVSADPRNPRLNYQLARAMGYSGRHEEAQPYRDVAVMSGYPQSLFVFGFIQVTGWSGNAKNVCQGAELIRLSAIAGRKAGLLGFPHYVVNGAFDACPVKKDPVEMRAFIERARPMTSGFYEQMLVDNLLARLPPAS